ncbi:UNVERIFIED_CONTAM: hypothetical protein GTU68_046746 [Idotea baltica]|nr:hypothetical protein [Idotea baltica]
MPKRILAGRRCQRQKR